MTPATVRSKALIYLISLISVASNLCCDSEFSYVFAVEFSLSLLVFRPSQGFWGTGGKGIYFRGTGEQRPIF